MPKVAVFLGAVAMTAIRAPHGQRSRFVKVVKSGKGGVEQGLLVIAWISFLTPFLWMLSPWLAFADYPLRSAPFVAGVALMIFGLWIFHRSHADLGTNWSVTLEVRETHTLVTGGIYRRIRHPMYLSLLVYSLGQALVVPNWIAGPSYLVAMTLIFAFRLGPEERLMMEQFGDRYAEYRARSKRLVPGLW